MKFTVYGEPLGLKRHRHFSAANKIMLYDPSKEDKHDFLWVAMNNKPKKPLEGALDVTFQFYFKRPKSHFGTGRNKGILKKLAPLYVVKKPDIDNVMKFVMDSLNGIFWRDDAIIVIVNAIKIYSHEPKTEIIINEL